LVKVAATVLGHLIGAYFVVRAVVEVVTVDYGNSESYENDWGGPSLEGVLVVHCVLGLVSLRS
jgi:hypothetical protein